MKNFGFLLLTAGITLAGCSGAPSGSRSSEAPSQEADAEIFKATVASVPQACEGGGIATGDELAALGRIDVRAEPSASAKRVINERATQATGETFYQAVDNTETLTEVCRQEKWTKVRVADPALSFIEGWVPVSAVRVIEKDAGGVRRYVESDFTWDKSTSPYKKELVRGVNRILRENAECQSIQPMTLAKSSDRSAAGKPVFFVTCMGAHPFNVWFEPEEAADGAHSFAATQMINQGEALKACESAAKQAANNPQTVSFSKFWDVAFVPYANGRSRLISSFKAKNSFGLESKFQIACYFEGSKMTNSNIAIDKQ